MAYTIYCHTSPDGKKYIGCTSTSTAKRFSNGHGYQKNPLFWEDISKYGWDSFKHEILYSGLDRDTAYRIEADLINKLNLLDSRFGYNLWDGKSNRSKESAERVSQSRRGTKNCVGRTLSSETRNKISESLSRYYAEHDNPFRGKHHSSETIEMLKNRVFSEETRSKMSKNHADVSGSKNPSAKPIKQFTKEGEFVAEYDFAKQAAAKYGIDLSAIIKCCRGKVKSAGGYVWRYSNN